MNRTFGLFQRSLLLIASSFFIFQTLSAQLLQVTDVNTPPFTPQNLISNIFLGDGVEVTSITFNGEPAAVGYFNGGTQSVGIERGIVMTTGVVESTGGLFGLTGCADVGNDFASNDHFLNSNDADLEALTTADIHDLAVYTITFIPTSDTLRFRYCFGSEEYPEYACDIYNDVFGFFIQGPGYPAPTNIARIPGTALPVTINNIHPNNPLNSPCPAAYLQYYNDNNGSNKQPTYDGYTDVFTAEAVVTPCQSYTIKLAIADAGDGAWDSGVFLEAKSFGTGSLRVEVATASLDGTVVEGCAEGMLTFKLGSALPNDFPIDYNIWGTATNGVDYQTIPSTLTLPAGQTSISLPIIGIEDNAAEAPEFIAIDVQRDPCNRDTFYISLKDNILVKPTLPADTVLCSGFAPLSLKGTAPVPLPPPPSFTNTQDFPIPPNGTVVNSPINVLGVKPQLLDSGVIRSVCLNITHSFDDDLDLFLISPSGQFLELSTDNGANGDNYTNTCFTPIATTKVNFPGPVAPASAAPFTGDWLPEGVWTDLWDGDYPTNGTWKLQARDDANGFNGTITDWTITFEPIYKINYQWSPAAGLACPTCDVTEATPTQTTTYTVVATDSYGCTVSDEIKIEVVNAMPAPVISCGAITNNSVTFNWAAVPGATGYQVNVNGAGWVPVGNVTTYLAGGLQPGANVTIEVQGIGSMTTCNALIGSASCSNCDPPTATVAKTDATCAGLSNGSVTVTPDNLNPPYTFALGTDNNTTGVFSNLAAGNYVVTVTDATGCSANLNVTIGAPAALAIAASVTKNVSCFGGTDGTLTAAVTGGGSGTVTYKWNDPAGQNTAVANNLAAGTYVVTATDGNGCSATATASITQPTDLALSALGSLAKCFGQASGSASASASGGTTPYTFTWSNAVSGQQNPNILAGNYFVTVTDANGCAETAFVSVGQPPQLTATATAVPANCNGSADGSATVTAGGGSQPYTYKWSDAAGQTTVTATGLPAQTYTVTVTDSKGCSLTQTAQVTAPTALSATTASTNALCNGGTGSATVTATGGTGPYTYKWSDPQNQGTPTAANLPAGNYTVTVTDAKGCTMTSTATVAQPEAVQLSTNVVNITCFGGSNGAVTVQAAGGTTPYGYKWSSSETTPGISGKKAGTYSVTVTDAKGCTSVIQATLTEPEAIQLAVDVQDIRCFAGLDGQIQLTTQGGVPGYTVTWSGPNGFSGTGNALNNLAAGTYAATVTDAAGCTSVTSADLTQPQAALLLDLPEIADTVCFLASNGKAKVAVSGGTAPYSYLWNDVVGQNAAEAVGLPSAPYNVTVTDANGCTQTAQTFIFQKEELFAFAEPAAPPCFGQAQGSASVTAVFYGANNASLTAFTYLWSTTPAQTGVQATGLQPLQTYSVTVTDASGCTDVQSVTIGDAAEFSASISGSGNVKCFGEATGWASAAAVGGTAPYTYFWTSGSQTDATAQNLAAGTYSVTVTDANQCPATATVTITQPPALKINLVPTHVKCYGESNGSAKAIASGGTPPYSYQWGSGNGQGQEVRDLPAGTAGLVLTDANGCQASDSVAINQPASAVGGSAEKRDPLCFGGHDGEVDITASGGTPPYRYALDNRPFNGSPKQIGIGAGIYTPKIMDKNGCTAELTPIEVEQRDQIMVELGPDITIELGENTQLLAQVSNAVGSIMYAWNPKDSLWLSCLDCPDPFVDSLQYQNIFKVQVKDSLGCFAEDLIRVVVDKPRKVFVPTAFSPNGDLNNDLLLIHGQSNARVLDFRVYDRWGEQVFQTGNFNLNDTAAGWDGNFRDKPLDPGVYVWILEVQYIDGVREVFRGNTTLIR